jgi:RNA polymerase sigma factor (sigma-70 family)
VTSATQQAIDAVWRIESARLIAGLARVVSDVGLAEDLAQDALVAALEQWPESGVPDNPGAWLMAVARRRGVDTIRRAATLQRKVELLGRELSDHETPMDEIEFDPHVEDDVLRLMFTACHPVLSVEARVALTLKMVAGLSTEEIARAFLLQTTTMAARITRAKKALTEANVPFEVPVGEELADRLSSVLEVVYLVFNEGYTATAGEQWARAELCQEAMRLGRMLAALAAGESETHAPHTLISARPRSSRLTGNGMPIIAAWSGERSRPQRGRSGKYVAPLTQAMIGVRGNRRWNRLILHLVGVRRRLDLRLLVSGSAELRSMVVRPLVCLCRCRDGVGEIGWPAPHWPVPGRQVDQLEVAQARYLGEQRVPAASQLEQLGRRQRARDDRGGDIQSPLVAQMQAVAGHVAGNRHRAAAECRQPLIVEAVQAGPTGGELVPGWQRDGLDVVGDGLVED